MKVLFIYSLSPFYRYEADKPLDGNEQLHFGISYISSLLKAHGHETRLVVATRRMPLARVLQTVKVFQPRLIAFTAIATEYHFIKSIAKAVREHFPGTFLLIGGAHVSLVPEESMLEVFDALCVGEGEYSTLELAQRLEKGESPAGIAGLWVKTPAGSVRAPPRPYAEDLDAFPFPDRDMWRPWVRNAGSRPHVLLGRGCPFDCTYCCNHALRKLSTGRYVRHRSPANIVAELNSLTASDPQIGEVYLEVETLGVNMSWTLDLCAALETFNRPRSVPLAFAANLRVTPALDGDKLFSAMAKSGFRTVQIGLESGSERVRSQILGRNYSNEAIVKTVRSARVHGLKVGFFNMIGVPGETPEDFLETVRMNVVCAPDVRFTYVFYPYPGTDLHRRCMELGLSVTKPEHLVERRGAVMSLPGFSRRQINKAYRHFDLLVSNGYYQDLHILRLKLLNLLYASGFLLRLYQRLRGTRLARRKPSREEQKAA